MNIERWIWPQVWERDALEPEILEIPNPRTETYEFLGTYKSSWSWSPVIDSGPLFIWPSTKYPLVINTDNTTFANYHFGAWDETRPELTPLEKKREAKASLVKFCNEKRNREWRHSSFG